MSSPGFLRRMILPLIFGLAGAAILIGLGAWQMQRLSWKQGILSEIETRIHATPRALPAVPEPERDRYLPVRAEGRFTGELLRVLASRKLIGPGYRIIAVFETGNGSADTPGLRRIMVDLGFLPEGEVLEPPHGMAEVRGNLHWPQEVDSFTPEPDRTSDLWFARDVPAMALELASEPVLIVASTRVVAGIEPMPVDIVGIPNDHFGYALTWFSLAACWLGMTLLYLWRIYRRTEVPKA